MKYIVSILIDILIKKIFKLFDYIKSRIRVGHEKKKIEKAINGIKRSKTKSDIDKYFDELQ